MQGKESKYVRTNDQGTMAARRFTIAMTDTSRSKEKRVPFHLRPQPRQLGARLGGGATGPLAMVIDKCDAQGVKCTSVKGRVLKSHLSGEAEKWWPASGEGGGWVVSRPPR